jgi:hypothetical protein
MEQEILDKVTAQEKKLEDIYQSVEKTRKYFLWTLIITAASIILPLIVLAIVIPRIISFYTSALNF